MSTQIPPCFRRCLKDNGKSGQKSVNRFGLVEKWALNLNDQFHTLTERRVWEIKKGSHLLENKTKPWLFVGTPGNYLRNGEAEGY